MHFLYNRNHDLSRDHSKTQFKKN